MAIGVNYYITGSTNMSGSSDSQIVWYIVSQDIENNTSTIHFLFRVRKQNSSSTTSGYGNWTLKMGSQTATVGKNVSIKNSWVNLISTQRVFTHNPDGTLSMYVSGTGGIGSGSGYSKTTNCNDTIIIDTIPRATEPTITNQTTHPIEDYYFGDKLNFVLTPASNNFTHDVYYAYDNNIDISEETEWTTEWTSLILQESETSIEKEFSISSDGYNDFPPDINYAYLHFKTETYITSEYDVVDSQTGEHTLDIVRTDLGQKYNTLQVFQATNVPQIVNFSLEKKTLSAITNKYVSNLSKITVSAIASFEAAEEGAVSTNFSSGVLIFNEQTYPLTSFESSVSGQNVLKALVNPEDSSSDEVWLTISSSNVDNRAYIKIYDNFGFSAETSLEITSGQIVSYVTPEISSFNAIRVDDSNPPQIDASGERLSINYSIETNNASLGSDNLVTVKTQVLPTNAISGTSSWYEIHNGTTIYNDTGSSISSAYVSNGYYPVFNNDSSITSYDKGITYTLRLSLQDYVMSQSNMPPLISYAEIKQAGALMSWKAGGTNITFGGQASSASENEAIDCMWKVNAYDGINVYEGDIKLGIERNNVVTLNSLFDLIYPVGSIYISTVNTNPGIIFNNDSYWEPFAQGRTIIGVGTGTDINSEEYSFDAEDVGGEYNHTLDITEIPSHKHPTLERQSGGTAGSGWGLDVAEATRNWNSNKISATGGDANGNTVPHNNMPPYIAVYIWRRCNPPAQQGE